MSLQKSTKQAGRPYAMIRSVLRLRIPLAIATMAFAVFGLVANFANVDVLSRPLNGGATTHPVTALCLFGLGFAVFRLKRFGSTAIWRYLVGGMILMVCTARIMEAVVTHWLGTELSQMFGPFWGFHGRFSIESAMALGAFALAGMLRQRHGRWGMGCLLAGLAVVYNAMLEVSYGMTFFNGDVGGFTLMGLVCAALAMVTVYVHRPFVRVLLLVGDIGNQTRVMATTVVVIPWLSGYALHTFKDIDTTSAPIEAAMVAVITWVMLVILMTTSARHEGSDAARRRGVREIALMSRVDPLTKALNRFGMTEVLEGAWLQFRAIGGTFGLILVDLDYFARINETFGHAAGDDVLERVSATLYPHLRTSDALGRWGGGEFLILLKVKEKADLEIVAHRLRVALESLESPFCQGLNGVPSKISASIGISDMRLEDDGPIDAIKRADMALHQGKALGRGVVQTYQSRAAA